LFDSVETGDREEAASDLATYDQPEVESALGRAACDPLSDSALTEACGESLAEIWVRKGAINHDLICALPPYPLEIVLGILADRAPELDARARTFRASVSDAVRSSVGLAPGTPLYVLFQPHSHWFKHRYLRYSPLTGRYLEIEGLPGIGRKPNGVVVAWESRSLGNPGDPVVVYRAAGKLRCGFAGLDFEFSDPLCECRTTCGIFRSRFEVIFEGKVHRRMNYMTPWWRAIFDDGMFPECRDPLRWLESQRRSPEHQERLLARFEDPYGLTF
jgi:hypothetical protein